MTVALLMSNTVVAAKRVFEELINVHWKISYLPITPLEKVTKGIHYKTLQNCNLQKMDRLRSNLVYLLLSVRFYGLEKQASLPRN